MDTSLYELINFRNEFAHICGINKIVTDEKMKDIMTILEIVADSVYDRFAGCCKFILNRNY